MANLSTGNVQQTFHQEMSGVQERKQRVRVFNSFSCVDILCAQVLVGTDNLLGDIEGESSL